MTTAHIVQLILAVIAALSSGGVIGAYLTHRRRAPISEAESVNMNWERFQKEINRLDAKVAAQSSRIDTLEREVRDCHRDKAEQAAEMMKLRALLDGKGEIAQRAAMVAAADRLGQIGKGGE